MLLLAGGFICGFAAGAAARYGRLCTMGAIEEVLVAHDSRALKAWGLALAVAIGTTQILSGTGLVHLTSSIYAGVQLSWLSALVGGVLFGLGMALVGTCSFGLIVRAGTGDLRAVLSALLVGIFAFAAIAGPLSFLRTFIGERGVIELPAPHGTLLPALIADRYGAYAAVVVATGVVLSLVVVALTDRRLWRRPRLLGGALLLGLSIAGGWLVTSLSILNLDGVRAESLSFVAPVGRMLIEFMGGGVQGVEFGAATVVGVACGAFCVALAKDEIQWEAFDDAREMQRHILGAALMGLGGVLAKGCTIGQGMSAASALALSAPIVIVGIMIGAKLGLTYLLEGGLPEGRRQS